jgi:aldose 1-epimerase
VPTASRAWVKSRLEFSRQPLWMKQFPFAHTIEMDATAFATACSKWRRGSRNLSVDPMPVAIGFHPYFQTHRFLAR